MTVEDVLEILAGLSLRKVNVKLDIHDTGIIQSIAARTRKNIALTDKQLAVVLEKIVKYKVGLLLNDVDVDAIIKACPLRLPIRYLNREKTVELSESKTRITVKFVFNKKLGAVWSEVSKKLTPDPRSLFLGSSNSAVATELNVYEIVTAFKPLGFTISPEVQEIYNRVVEIMNEPEAYIPCVDLDEGSLVYRNVPDCCMAAVTSESAKHTSNITLLERLPAYGIYAQTNAVKQLISDAPITTLSKKILLSSSRTLRLKPSNYTEKEILNSVAELNQFPLLIVLDAEKHAYTQITELVPLLTKHIKAEEITVFFRLASSIRQSREFAQYVKDNKLNGFIDDNTKVVFILKNKVPRALVQSNWQARTVLLIGIHLYGRTAAYVNNAQTIYHFNDHQIVIQDKAGVRKIVEL